MGKLVPNSSRSYYELRAITDAVYGGKLEVGLAFQKTYAILVKYGIRLRDKDGQDPKMTISPPDDNTLVVGIRYLKDSGRTTEDHFIFRRSIDLYRCKGKEINKILPQYTGSHELNLSRNN
jgi:hypothetical protein